MQLISLRRPLQAAAANSCRAQAALPSTCSLGERLALLRLDVGPSSNGIGGRRWASVKSQGAYKLKNKKTIPKKLGAKRTGDQYVIPGNILYKQRGTIWHAGENAILGRDHTIHAAVAGYVKYYRDPARHPTKQYIGVAFDRQDKLPYPANEPRRRRLGLVAVQRKTSDAVAPTLSPSGIPLKVVRQGVAPVLVQPAAKATAVKTQESEPADVAAQVKAEKRTRRQIVKKRKAELAQLRVARRKIQKDTRVLHLQPDYSYREHNWEIGRLVGAAGRIQGATKPSRRAGLRLRHRQKQIVFGTRRSEKRRRKEAHQEQLAERKAANAAEAKKIAKAAAKTAASPGKGAKGPNKTPA